MDNSSIADTDKGTFFTSGAEKLRDKLKQPLYKAGNDMTPAQGCDWRPPVGGPFFIAFESGY